METFRIGQTVDRAVYGRPPGAPAPVLLLAAGQRIESEQQIRRLREAGFTVHEAGSLAPPPSAPPLPAAAPRPASRPPSFTQRLEAAQALRQALAGATRELLSRVDSGLAPDVRSLLSASTMLAGEVAADPYGVVALTHLRQCDDYTVEHCADVSILMVAIGRLQGLPEEELRVLALGGLVHDVGKQRVPKEITAGKDPLPPDQLAEAQRHPVYGREILADCADCPESVPLVALQHHERMDGSGYPHGLRGEALHPHSRIAAVANVFDSLTSERGYRRGMPPRQALMQIYGAAGARFDPAAVSALIKLVGVYPVGSRVTLDSGERAVVVAPNPHDTSRPIIEIDQDFRGRSLACPIRVELQSATYSIVAAQ